MNIKDYFVAVLKAYLHNERIALDDSIDYFELFRLAINHNLAAVVFCVIKQADNRNIVPPNLYKQMEDAFFDSIYRYDMQSKAICALNAVLSDNCINHTFFKGAEIKEYYPVPEARSMTDIDVLISPEDRDRVKELLTANGFGAENTNGPVYDYTYNDVCIEMHTKIVSGKVGNSNAEESFLDAIDHAIYSRYTGTLEPSYHFAYQIAHIAHHFWFYGAGIKLILDLAVMMQKFDIDIDYVISKMGEIGLDKFTKLMLTLCYKWFGVGVDFGIDTEETEVFLLSYGAFGNANRNHSAVIERKEMEEGRSTNAFVVKLRLLFPSYKRLKDIPYIGFIEGRPWLTPIAWIYRIFYNLKNRRKFMINATSSIGSAEAKKRAIEELAYFEEIGLL